MPEAPKLTLDSKYLGAGLAAIGVVALAAAGFVTITTPGEEECNANLTEARVDLADKSARLELLTEAKDACKTALESLTESTP